MRKHALALLAGIVTLVLIAPAVMAKKDTEERIDDLEKAVQELRIANARDRIDFSGDYRFQAHNLHFEFPDHFDGMGLQNLTVGTMFYFLRNFDGENMMSGFPPNVAAIRDEIALNYGDWRYFADNLSFDALKEFMGGFDPQSQQMLMEMLMPATFTEGYEADNDILYTNRLRLRMQADVADKITFDGRIAMYKTWGDATGLQVFNGQSNSFIIDGNSASVPNGDFLRVERAFFTWKNIANSPLYLSIGRRPSTGGPPMHLRQDEKRGGSPMASLIDFQFDGITGGWVISPTSTFRVCYGQGYESQYGNGLLRENPLKDAHFLGLNWDIYHTDEMFVQTTVARAFDVTDGFNGLIVLPDNPVTGEPVGAPVMMRFSPSANLGDIDIAGLLVMRSDGAFDYFASFNYMKSHPENVTTPFGGLFADPFEVPESQDGTMFYAGARYSFNRGKTKLGLEYNHGSEYWFNFTPAQDDIIAPKTNTRGDVWEAYLQHRFDRRFGTKLAFIHYNYEYSGSGWQLGTPKKLDDTPILGYSTYSRAWGLSLAFTAQF